MARLRTETRTVYVAPTKGRAYLTKSAAAFAEARAMLTRKYPTEHSNEHNDGWHWTERDDLRAVYSRLARLLRRA